MRRADRERMLELMDSFDSGALRSQGIEVVSWGPTQDGYVRVGVLNDVATAQRKLDAIYGRNAVRVYHQTDQPSSLR